MRKLFTFLLIATASAAVAQTGGIKGKLSDGDRAVPGATVSICRAADTSIVQSSIATAAGTFSFNSIQPGNYLIQVTAVGYSSAFSRIVEVNSTIIEVPQLTIKPQSRQLSAVTVQAKKAMIEHKIDRTVVNVDASITNSGSTALEVLEKSPGVTVDRDGNVSLKGKAGVMILIDGRPTQLSGADLANYLRNLNASSLDQIELMTNPPAKYDAAGTAGIINIKTKKIRQMGYNGSASVSYGQGFLPKFNESLNMNYRSGKWNLFTNLNHGYRERNSRLSIRRNFRDETSKDVVSQFDQVARMKNAGSNYSAKIGADFFASKKTTVGVVLNGYSGPNNFVNNNTTNIFDAQDNFISSTKAISEQKEAWKNLSTNLNFRQLIDTTGKELTADLDYMRYKGNNDQRLSNYYFDEKGLASRKGDTLYGRLPQDINIYSGRIDYYMPLKHDRRFEAGLKSSYVKTINQADYDTVYNSSVIQDLSRTNGFDYEETIHAAYLNYNTPITKKLSAQLGLRYEHTSSKGYSTGYSFDQLSGTFLHADTSFKKSYGQLFPTAYLQYKADEKNVWGANYGRRIRRPNYESLNPFIEYLDRYTYKQGNPNLNPQFSHNLELSHSYRNMITTSFNYSVTTNILQQVLEQNDATNETYIKEQNIARQRQYGVAVNTTIPVTKWWTSNVYVNVAQNRFSGLVNATAVEVEATTFSFNGSQQFKVSKTFNAEVSGWFRSGGIDGIFESKPMGSVSAGLSQQVIKGKGMIRLSVRDIFYTQGFRGGSRYGTVDVRIRERNDSRVVTLGFSYRFSKGKMNSPARKRSNANEEQSRVGGGS